MSFWVYFGAFIVASGVVYLALSINGKTEAAGDHGHDDHGHGGHGHH